MLNGFCRDQKPGDSDGGLYMLVGHIAATALTFKQRDGPS